MTLNSLRVGSWKNRFCVFEQFVAVLHCGMKQESSKRLLKRMGESFTFDWHVKLADDMPCCCQY
jgi:hypothetical protein